MSAITSDKRCSLRVAATTVSSNTAREDVPSCACAVIAIEHSTATDTAEHEKAGAQAPAFKTFENMKKGCNVARASLPASDGQ
ncbi:MAG: hypothetical protein RR100_00200, partial [Comamonas sp.]